METANCGCCRDDLPWEGRGTKSGYLWMPFFSVSYDRQFCISDSGRSGEDRHFCGLEPVGRPVHRLPGESCPMWRMLCAPCLSTHGSRRYIWLWKDSFPRGCPGDTDGDSLLDREGEAPNRAKTQDRHFPVLCKLALYPMGTGDYIDEIAKVWRMAEAEGLNPKTIHYATRIEGDVQKVFDYLEEVCRLMEQSVPHYILHFTLSVNSPTMRGKEQWKRRQTAGN